MGRFTGVLGLLAMLGLAYLFSTNRRAIKLKMVIWGLGLQIAFAFLVFYWTFGQMLFYRAGNGVNKLLAYARQATVLDRIHFRVSGFADDYFYRVAVCAALLPGRHAGGDSSGGVGDAAGDGRERRGIVERCGEHLYGADGSAVDHPAVSSGLNAIRVDDHHDERHGARIRRNHGGVHCIRSGSAAPAYGGDHDRAGDAVDFQNAGAGN
jgi:hypothetical protein